MRDGQHLSNPVAFRVLECSKWEKTSSMVIFLPAEMRSTKEHSFLQ